MIFKRSKKYQGMPWWEVPKEHRTTLERFFGPVDNPAWDMKDMKSLPAPSLYPVSFTGHLDTQIQKTRNKIDYFMDGYGYTGWKGEVIQFIAALGVVLFWGTILAILVPYLK